MSAKQFKSMRRAVRALKLHPRDVKLKPMAQQYIPGNQLLGHPGAMFLGQRVLDKNCGRAIYHALKKAERRGEVQNFLKATAV